MVTVSPGQNPTSQSFTVTANLTSIGGLANQPLFDDGSNGDQVAGDGVYSFQLAATGTPGAHSLPATVTDDQNRTSNATIHYGIGNCGFNAASTVVISQVYGGGGGAGAIFDGDYVELFNRGFSTVVVDGWSVQYASSGGGVNAQQIRNIAGSIPAGGYYLVRMSNQTPGDPLPTPDAGGDVVAGGGIFMASDTGKVFLANITTPIASCTDAAIMDAVGYGDGASCFEGAGPTTPSLTAGSAAFRKNGGCQDSNENFNDFERLFPTPRNSASPTHSCGLSPCCRNDYNGDGSVGTDADIEAFFACLSGNCCPTCPPNADYNCDGGVGTDSDIESFFRVLSGGAC
jgi:hypothetical protein